MLRLWRWPISEGEPGAGSPTPVDVTIAFPDSMHVDVTTPQGALTLVTSPNASFMAMADLGGRTRRWIAYSSGRHDCLSRQHACRRDDSAGRFNPRDVAECFVYGDGRSRRANPALDRLLQWTSRLPFPTACMST